MSNIGASSLDIQLKDSMQETCCKQGPTENPTVVYNLNKKPGMTQIKKSHIQWIFMWRSLSQHPELMIFRFATTFLVIITRQKKHSTHRHDHRQNIQKTTSNPTEAHQIQRKQPRDISGINIGPDLAQLRSSIQQGAGTIGEVTHLA